MLIAAAEEIPAALSDHWEDVTTAMHDADARHLYVDVAEPLATARADDRRVAAAESRPASTVSGAQGAELRARTHRRGRAGSSRRSCAAATG